MGVACVILGACTGFSSGSAPADPPTDPSAHGGTDSGPVNGEGVVASITISVESGKKTWIVNRPNQIKFTVTRGDRVSGRIVVTVRGLPAGSVVVPAAVENSATQGAVTFRPSADSPQGELALTLEASLVDSAAKASASLDSFLRGAPGDVDTTFATKGSVVIPANAESAVGTDGRLYVVRSDLTTERYLADGRLDLTFQTNGRGSYPQNFGKVRSVTVAGSSVLALFEVAGGSGNRAGVLKTSLDGVADPSFGIDGNGFAKSDNTGRPVAVARSATGQIALAGADYSLPPRGGVHWLTATGGNGDIDDGNPARSSIPFAGATWDASGLLVIGGDTLGRMFTGTQHFTINNFGGTGSISVGANVALYGIDLEGANIVVSGVQTTSGAPFVSKLKPNANGPYPGFTFEPAAVSFDTTVPTKAFLAGDGSILQTGRQARSAGCAVTRYLATGAPDPTFGTNGVAVLPVTPCAPTNIAVHPDGRIIVNAGSLGTTPASTRIVRLWN